MTVIRPNSIAGISSIFALGDQVQFLKADGMPAGVSIAGTVTFDDVTNVDSIGIVTARAGINVGNPEINVTISPNGDANFLGSVGIGTDSPINTLHVSGAGTIARLESSTSTTSLRFHNSAASDGYIRYISQDLIFTTADEERLRIEADGDYILGGTTNYAYIRPWESTTGNLIIGADQSSTGTNGSSVVFRTRGGEKARIDSSGNLGIGTASPRSGLHLKEENPTITLQPTADTQHSYIDFRNAADVNSRGFIGYNLTDDYMNFRTNGSGERMRIDSDGRLLVGATSVPPTINSQNQFIVEQADNYVTAVLATNQNNPNGSYLTLQKSRSSTLGGNAIVQNDDQFGGLVFAGADGGIQRQGGQITCEVDGTPGSADMPGRIVFRTTAAGSVTPTERMRIGQTGNVLFYNATNYVAPFTDNAVTSGASGRRWSQVWSANGTIQTSDERLKTEIADSSLATDFIKSLRPVSYKWIEGGKRHTGEYDEDTNFVYETVAGARTHWGFIAQEVKQSADNAGIDFGGWVLEDKDDADSTQSLRYDQFIAPLTKALQEAIAKIETLETQNADLAARITTLETN